MHTQVCNKRLDCNDEPIKGWSANQQPAYPFLAAILEELAFLNSALVAEIGADYNDDEPDALSIVLADQPYFSECPGCLREMCGWLAVDFGNASYFGINPNGEEFVVPLSDPNAIEVAAKKLLEDDDLWDDDL